MSARHNRPAPCEQCAYLWDWSGLKCRRFHERWERAIERDYWADQCGTFSVPWWCLPPSKLRGPRHLRRRSR